MIVCVVSHNPHYTKTFLEYWRIEGVEARLVFSTAVDFGSIDIHHQWVADQHQQPVWNCQQSPQILAKPQDNVPSHPNPSLLEPPMLCA